MSENEKQIIEFVRGLDAGSEVVVVDDYHQALLASGLVERRADGFLYRTYTKDNSFRGQPWHRSGSEIRTASGENIVFRFANTPMREDVDTMLSCVNALAGRDPAKLEALVEAVRNVINDRHTFHGKDDDKDWCRVCGQNFRDTGRHFRVGETSKTDRDALRAALDEFEEVEHE